eukprot:TRINITY_DN814_c0_g1_i1.p2 TRINITY_DN814_c0_g1~~TRINITY_DN814_c0_g1_i1.p2  ORF type:complete len:223 (+),score=22.38 TRINITY_DN814_c0_g1_i1:1192-1860(+)
MVVNVTFNHLADGGAIFHEHAGTMTLVSSTFTKNMAAFDVRGRGGVIFSNGADLRVNHSTLTSNSAGGDGGCMWVRGPGEFSVANTFFAGCSAVSGMGGAMFAGEVHLSCLNGTITSSTALQGAAMLLNWRRSPTKNALSESDSHSMTSGTTGDAHFGITDSEDVLSSATASDYTTSAMDRVYVNSSHFEGNSATVSATGCVLQALKSVPLACCSLRMQQTS